MATFRAWDEYAITGMKIEFTPNGFYPNAQANTGIRALQKCDSLNDYATIQDYPSEKMYTAAGFQTLDPRRKWKKYYSLKKLSK